MLLVMLLSTCRIYDPMPIDCRIHCAADGSCPTDTRCIEGFCRTKTAILSCQCRAGDERLCGSSQGSCQPGVQRCAGNEWGACEGAIEPRAELCNSLDDDCDGVVDEELALPPDCALTLGVCRATSQQCLGGTWRECAPLEYGPSYEEKEVSCDGLDNDCDGLVDSREVVTLGPQPSGAWYFLTTEDGFAIVSTTQALWLSRALEIETSLTIDAGEFLATARGDTLVLASRSDAGVKVTSLERDGGSTDQVFSTWLAPSALDLSVDVAAAIVTGQVELVSIIDGGAPISLGSDTDGTLRLSHTGESLAWSGGVIRTGNLATQSSGSPGPLLALLQVGTRLIGVPASQPADPVFLADVLAGRLPQPITSSPVPALFGLQATEHRGRVMLVGVEGTSALWVVTEGGTQRRLIGPQLDSVRVTPSHETFAAFAWLEGGVLSAVRRCAP